MMTVNTKAPYHIATRLLVIAAIVAVLPLAVGFLLIQHSAKTRLSDAAGENFYWFAERAAAAVDAAVVRELEFTASIVRSPAVTDNLSDERIVFATEYLEAISASSRLYREFRVLDPTGAFFMKSSDESLDQEMLASVQRMLDELGKGKRVEVRARVDEDRGSLTLYRPVREPDSEQLLGLVLAELDTERLFMSVSDLRVGQTGHACLFDRSSGRLLAGRSGDCAEGEARRYVRFDEQARAYKQGARYFLAGVGGPASFDRGLGLLVGHARPGLSLAHPELDWVVAVEQFLAESHAPLSPLFRDLIGYFLGMGLLTLALAAYMSYKLERPLAETAIDLHDGEGKRQRTAPTG